MFVEMRTTVDGDVAASRGIEMMGRQARDLTEPLTAVGEILLESIGEQYDSEGAFEGTEWAPLSDDYAAWKERHGPGLPLLIGLRAEGAKGTRHHPIFGKRYEPSGETRERVLSPVYLHVRSDYLLYEPESAVAGYHQRGTEKMPARPIVVLGPGTLHEMDRVWVRWVNSLMSLVKS